LLTVGGEVLGDTNLVVDGNLVESTNSRGEFRIELQRGGTHHVGTQFGAANVEWEIEVPWGEEEFSEDLVLPE
jgi:hypothetical protein